MKINLTEPNSYTRHLTVEVEEERLSEKFEGVVRDLRRTLQLPGFRAGKAPREMVLAKYGPALRQEAVEKVVSETLEAAFREKSVVPIAQPVLKKVDAKPGSPLVYEATVEVDPPVVIDHYSGLSPAPDPAPVTGAHVDALLDELRDRLAALNPVDRPVAKGDYADLEYQKVVVGGEERKDFQSPTHPVEVGGSRLTALEEGIVGLKNGDEKTIEFTFPQDYPAPALAGKAAAFTVKVGTVREKVLPPLDDALAREVRGDAATLEDLKEKLRVELEGERRQEALGRAQEEAIDKILERNPFEVPESRVHRFLEHSYGNYLRQAKGAPPVSREDFDRKNRQAAIREVKRYKVLEVVAKKENIKSTSEEVDTELKKFAALTGQTFEKLKSDFKRDGRILNVRENIRDRKTLEFLAGVVPVSASQA